MKNGFYVYRFIDFNNEIIYVGRTKDLRKRFKQHSQLTNEVSKIEYIICTSEAEMVWKEIYYINLYYNKNSANISDVYLKGKMKPLNLNDTWVEYEKILINRGIVTRTDYLSFMNTIPKHNYKQLIKIVNDEKINEIGKDKYSLSEKWFRLNKNNDNITKLKNNIYNFFNNKKHVGKLTYSLTHLWTTYYDYKDLIKGKGYTKGYVELDGYRSYGFPEKTELAFIANIFLPANKENYDLSEDEYAIFCLLSFLLKSGIRDGKHITVYIPSKRMRNLLMEWIEYQEYQE